ncbi:MAG: hypothetical protein HY936_01580 [Nitrosomonadales bacterium]|nr:hypothetical protein [Nitrosomonadales bacterium]
MSTRFMIDTHQYHSSHTQSLHTLFFRDNDEITLAEFYAAFFRRLRGMQ